MLKLKLPKSEFDALPDNVKAEYAAQQDGTYMLQTDVPFEDTTALKGALEHEKANRLTATTRVNALEQENATLKKSLTGDVTALEESWKTKYAARERELQGEVSKAEASVKTVLVGDVVSRIAARLNPNHPHLVIPHIKDRVTLEKRPDGQYITRILDKQGQPSAASENDFFTEILADTSLAPIVVASGASGGGAKGGGQKSVGDKGFDELTEAERTKLYRENKPEYDRLKGLRDAARQ